MSALVHHVTVRRALVGLTLVFAWCALWGEVSVANVLSGVAVAVVVSGLGIGTPGRGGVALGPLLRFGWLVAKDLVASTISVAREVLTPGDSTDEAIVAVEVPTETRAHLLLLIVAITVTPGTAVVDADPDTGTLYVHLLHSSRRADEIAHVIELAELAYQALPVGGAEPKEVSP